MENEIWINLILKIKSTDGMLLAYLFVIHMKEIVTIISVVLIVLVVYTFIYNLTALSETKIEKKSYVAEFQPSEKIQINKTSATIIKVPAVDKEGNGVMVTLSVEAKPGVGRTLADINQIFFWVDTQDSIRIAKRVAENMTGIDLSNYDIIYSVQANASAVEGPSAGAGMGIATILEIENRTFRNDVSITGTLDDNGKIGQVSGIIAKAQAAKNAGMDLFLVPAGQKIYTTFTEEKKCETYVFTTICRTEMKPKNVEVEKEVGIEAKEVSNIQEALKYFIS